MLNQIRKHSQSNHILDQPHPPHQQSTKKEDQSDLLMLKYEQQLRCYSQTAQTIIASIPEDEFTSHRMRHINVENSLLIKDENRLTRSDCCFFVVNTQFNGLEYIYQVLIGPFLLKIVVLNLNRNSDDNDQEIQKQQIGSGGFGSVRAVRIDNKNYAVKRIPFQYKLDSGFSYDIQSQCNEQYQLRRCLRQFCIFKIASLLGIGPKVRESGYDLICFNNCIQFRMELCQPVTTHQFSINRDTVDMNAAFQNLLCKVAMLHDLKIVHRDIKPENILYSPLSKGFVIGDFGMSLLIKQDIHEQTLTNFAGTPNFASPKMKALMNGDKGYINLYLNDFYGLKETIKGLEVIYNKQDSQISRNNMSYSGDFMPSNDSQSENFDLQQNSNGSLRHQTDRSYTSTGHSLINFTSASTQAPKQQASAFNHYQSQLIYFICRLKERRMAISMVTIRSYLEAKHLQKQNVNIETLLLDIMGLFNLTQSKKIQLRRLREWKAASRHFGPKNQRTQAVLEDIIKEVEKDEQQQELKDQLHGIRNKILGANIKAQQIQLRLAKTLCNFQSYQFFFYEFVKIKNNQLANSWTSLNSYKQKQVQYLQELDFIASEFLYYSKNSQVTNRYLLKVIKQVLAIHHRILGKDSLTQKEKGRSCLQICFQYLMNRQKLTLPDFYCYLKAKQKIEIVINRQQMRKLIKKVLQILPPITLHDNLAINLLYLELSVQYPQLEQSIFDNARKNLEILCQGHPERVLIRANILVLYNQFGYHKMVIDEIQKLKMDLQTNKKHIINGHFYHALLSKIYADTLLLMSRPQAEHYCLIALQQMHCVPGKTRVKQLYDLYNNLAYLRLLQKDYPAAKRYFTELRECLERQDYQDSNFSIIYTYQSLLRIHALMGIHSEEQKSYCKELVSLIVKNMHAKVTSDLRQIGKYIGCIQAKQIDPETRIFIAKQLIRNIQSIESDKRILALTHLKIAQIFCVQLKRYYEGQRYLWNFIELKQKNSSQFTQKIVKLYNYFTSLLLKSNSNRRAIIFMNSYLFRIPINMLQTKKKALRIMYSAFIQINDKRYKLYADLIRNDFQILITKRIDNFMIKQRNPYLRNIYKKWLKKI